LRAQKIAPLQRGAQTKDSGWRGGLTLCRRKKLRPYGAERTPKANGGETTLHIMSVMQIMSLLSQKPQRWGRLFAEAEGFAELEQDW
jgi:hypothetical protein